MASPTKIYFLVPFVITATILVSAASVVESRSLSNPPTSSLAVRLMKLNSGNCWESLMQLQACSGEIIAFFLNGETYIGNACCQGIRVIEHDCWPNIVSSLGFTTQETDILEGYCDEEAAAAAHSPPPPLSVVEPNKVIVP